MTADIEKLRNLIALNKLDRALQILKENISSYPELQSQLLTLTAKYNDTRQKETMGLLDENELAKMHSQLNFAVLELINDMAKGNAGSLQAQPTYQTQDTKKTVFISYNHNDSDIANKLKEKFEAKGIEVIIDNENMQAGENIKEFIEKCVRESTITVSLISRKSLLSAWVAMESINTFYHEKTNAKKKFIACYIENDFFKRTFTDEALDQIEGEIKELQSIITVRIEKNRSIRDLQNELARKTELRNNIDEIVRRLRESLCIDIRNEHFDINFQRIVEAIHS